MAKPEGRLHASNALRRFGAPGGAAPHLLVSNPVPSLNLSITRAHGKLRQATSGVTRAARRVRFDHVRRCLPMCGRARTPSRPRRAVRGGRDRPAGRSSFSAMSAGIVARQGDHRAVGAEYRLARPAGQLHHRKPAGQHLPGNQRVVGEGQAQAHRGLVVEAPEPVRCLHAELLEGEGRPDRSGACRRAPRAGAASARAGAEARGGPAPRRAAACGHARRRPRCRPVSVPRERGGSPRSRRRTRTPWPRRRSGREGAGRATGCR